jgi:hypothetical protein
MTPRRVVTWGCLVCCMAIITVFVILALQVKQSLRQSDEWWEAFYSIEETIHSLKRDVPAGCSSQDWSSAVGRLAAGFWNACHHPSKTPVESMQQLHFALQQEVSENSANPDLLLRMWDRIGAASPAAKRLIDAHRVDFETFVARCQQAAEQPSDAVSPAPVQ